MRSSTVPLDVFVSHSLADAALARRARQALEKGGFHCVLAGELAGRGSRVSDAVRRAIVECPVFVSVFSKRSHRSSSIYFELGAATSWGKRIIIFSPYYDSSIRLPFKHGEFQVATSNAQLLKMVMVRAESELSPEEIDALSELYGEYGVPSDIIATDPRFREEFAREFSKRTGIHRSAETLLLEILRRRKRGTWARLGTVRLKASARPMSVKESSSSPRTKRSKKKVSRKKSTKKKTPRKKSLAKKGSRKKSATKKGLRKKSARKKSVRRRP